MVVVVVAMEVVVVQEGDQTVVHASSVGRQGTGLVTALTRVLLGVGVEGTVEEVVVGAMGEEEVGVQGRVGIASFVVRLATGHGIALRSSRRGAALEGEAAGATGVGVKGATAVGAKAVMGLGVKAVMGVEARGGMGVAGWEEVGEAQASATNVTKQGTGQEIALTVLECGVLSAGFIGGVYALH